ncbi:hypothetical protein P7K49_008967 [Saguinus oedipus]|uniref:Uncharacterized protein n=1 Tax=Saguinus oedipus TaxID=9490 RepID=A0ABQ9VZ92_SAGOE|nr:hypothetical protein P7K49_008967 [Saguinus oedipus]
MGLCNTDSGPSVDFQEPKHCTELGRGPPPAPVWSSAIWKPEPGASESSGDRTSSDMGNGQTCGASSEVIEVTEVAALIPHLDMASRTQVSLPEMLPTPVSGPFGDARKQPGISSMFQQGHLCGLFPMWYNHERGMASLQ